MLRVITSQPHMGKHFYLNANVDLSVVSFFSSCFKDIPICRQRNILNDEQEMFAYDEAQRLISESHCYSDKINLEEGVELSGDSPLEV